MNTNMGFSLTTEYHRQINYYGTKDSAHAESLSTASREKEHVEFLTMENLAHAEVYPPAANWKNDVLALGKAATVASNTWNFSDVVCDILL